MGLFIGQALGHSKHTGEEIVLASGPYGMYLKCGSLNARIPKVALSVLYYAFLSAPALLSASSPAKAVGNLGDLTWIWSYG